MNLENLLEHRRRGEAAIGAAGTRVCIDLSGLTNGNSAALALLLAWCRAARAGDKALVFTGVPEKLRSIIGLTGMAELLPLEDARVEHRAPAAGRSVGSRTEHR